LINPGQSLTARYREILDSFSISPFPVLPVITRPASETYLDHVLTKFPDKVVSFGVRFSRAISDHCCIKPPPPVDRSVSFKDVNRIDYEFLLFRISMLDWHAIYATHVVDEQVCLLTGFIGQLYDVCVPLRRRFVPDSRTPWITVGLRDSIREQDAMNSRAPGFHALIETAVARLAERKFDQALPPKVLWSNFRSMGFCDSSDFSSTILLIFFCDLSALQFIVPPDPVRLDDAGFSFRHVDDDECLSAFMGITSNAIVPDGISLKFLKLLFPFIVDYVLHVFNQARSFRLCGRVLLFGR
jgi:hypothetical protein